MDKYKIMPFVKKALRKINEEGILAPYYYNLMASILEELDQAKLFTFSRSDALTSLQVLKADDPVYMALMESYLQLINLGYIVPLWSFPEHPSFNTYKLTSSGKEWISNIGPIPEDIPNYLIILKNLIPKLDPIILQYVQEALKTYERQTFFASAVMIGAASETVIYILGNKIKEALSDPVKKNRSNKSLQERSIAGMINIISESLEDGKKRKLIPYKISEGMDAHLLSLFESIRVQRNDAVHPANGTVSQECVYLSLTSFPFACKKMYDFIKWLKPNSL